MTTRKASWIATDTGRITLAIAALFGIAGCAISALVATVILS